MGDHHGLGFLRAGRLQHGHVDVVLGNGHVHEHRYRAVLDHGVDRGGEAAGHGCLLYTSYRVVGSLENTDRIMSDTFWVGVYPGMTDEMIDYMAKTIREAVL